MPDSTSWSQSLPLGVVLPYNVRDFQCKLRTDTQLTNQKTCTPLACWTYAYNLWNDAEYLARFIHFDDGHFSSSGPVNEQNCRFRVVDRSRWVYKVRQGKCFIMIVYIVPQGIMARYSLHWQIVTDDYDNKVLPYVSFLSVEIAIGTQFLRKMLLHIDISI